MSFDAMLIHQCTIKHRSVDQELKFDNKTEAFILTEIITGQSSGASGTLKSIVGDSNGVMVLTEVSGTFRDDETIVGDSQGSAAANGENYDHTDEWGQQAVTKAPVTVNCRFHTPKGDIKNLTTGDVFKALPVVTLPASVDPVVAETIVGLSEGFEHEYKIQNPRPACDKHGIHHWTCDLEVIE